ncbi:hypothetical protein BH18ACI4_BH18ACI4_06710 [soil metagenome]
MNPLRAENILLVAIARRSLDAEASEKLQQLTREKLDWDYLFAAAKQHGVLPLLHKHLNLIPESGAPTYFLTNLRNESVFNAQCNLYLANESLKILRLCKKIGLRIMAFKGQILSQLAYGENSLRQAGDIDLLVERKDFERAKHLLESLGYSMTPALTEAQQSSHLDFHCEIQFVRDQGFTVVDLHWALAPQSFTFSLETKAVMDRMREVSFLGELVETLAIEDLILYQCFHGTKHLWRQLEWISSLGQLISSRSEIEWALIIDRGEKARGKRMLGTGLWLAHKLTGAPVPESVFAELDRDYTVRSHANQLATEFFERSSGPTAPLKLFRYNLRVMDRARDAFACLLRSVFIPTLSDWQAIQLPDTFHLLYYPFRLLRLAKVYGGSIRRRL